MENKMKRGSLCPSKVFFLKCNPVKNLRGEEGTVGHKQFVVLILSAFSAEGCSTILVFSSFPTIYVKRMTMKEYKRQYRELDDETKEKIAASQRGRTKSESHRQHISQAMEKYWQTVPHRPNADENNDVQP